MLKNVPKRRVAEEIVQYLQRSIFNRTLQPGDRLPPERQLARRFGVNRASLREAIKQLEQLGLVATRQGDGTRVLDFMSSAGMKLLEYLIPHAIKDSPQLLSDLLEVRRILGREVARLAAERWKPEDLVELRRIHSEASSRTRNRHEILERDYEFYAALGRATQNRVVQLLFNEIRRAVALHPDLFVRLLPEPELTLQHQEEMLAALVDRDQAGAARVSEAHLCAMAERLDNG